MTSSEPELVVLANADETATMAADLIAGALEAAVQARGRADWATTGGSMAPPIYRQLAAPPWSDRVPWADTHVWWGDDRYVPRDHPLSNVKPFDDIVLAIGSTEAGQVGLATMGAARPVPLPLHQLHPFRTSEAIGGGRDAAWCAAELANELASAGLEQAGDWPVLDLILVGVGSDGHVLSVFPGSEAFDSEALALAIPAPTHIEPHVQRVTLNPRVLDAARQVVVVAAGAEKAGVIRAALRDEPEPRRLPVQLARRSNAMWILDWAAARELGA